MASSSLRFGKNGDAIVAQLLVSVHFTQMMKRFTFKVFKGVPKILKHLMYYSYVRKAINNI